MTSLSGWFVTDFEWPTEASHNETRLSEARTPTGDAVQDELDAPAFQRLIANRAFLEAKGGG